MQCRNRSCAGVLLLMCSLLANAAGLAQIGQYQVLESDVVFARAGAVDLQARIYRPDVDTILPAVIDIHGGAWSTGDRLGGQVYGRALASAGLYVFAVDFRQAPQFQHPAASQDIVAAIRYLQRNARHLRIDVSRLGLIGSSSGGHLAMLTGLMPNAAQFAGTSFAGEAGGFVAGNERVQPPRYVIALWPVSDPAYRYEYAKRSGRQDLLKSHDAYFGASERMLSASVPRAVRAGEAESLPFLLVVQPGKDANIPREMTLDLLGAYQEAGGALEYQFYPGQPHAFGHRASPATDALVRAMRAFIERRLVETAESPAK